jgi:hypothetical protein
MAFYVQSAGNLTYKVDSALRKLFGDKAEVQWYNGDVYVKVDADAGFVTEDHRLTDEEIAQSVCGGGRIDGLDGKMFRIKVEEIKEWPWAKREWPI